MSTATPASAEAIADRLNVKKASQYLGLSTGTLNKMRCEGRGPRYLKLGSRVFYRRQDLDTYLSTRLVETADTRQNAA